MVSKRDFKGSSGRIERARDAGAALALEAIVFLDMANIRYLVGFTGSDGALIVGEKSNYLLVDGRYTSQARREAHDAEIREYRDKVEGIASVIEGEGWKNVGIESMAVTLHDYIKLRDRLEGRDLRCLAEEVASLRAVKDTAEVDRVKEAIRVSSCAFLSVLAGLRPGVEEREVALELEYQIRRGGAENVSFETIVASGENSAMPHARPGRRRLETGDLVVIDYGAVCEGYCSDETCTVAVGDVSERQREVYGIVKEAHDRAIAAVRAGVACSEIDRVARNFLAERGLEKHFSHGTGHGVGLCVHEEPRLSCLSKDRLEPGMIVTVEPGIYLPGSWGIRIEDMVIVEEEGCEILTTVSKDLQVVG